MNNIVEPIIADVRKLVEKGEFATARQLIEAMLKKFPFFLYYEYLGNICVAQGDLVSARVAYCRALEQLPSDSWILRKIARLGNSLKKSHFAGRFLRYPDLTKKRQAEGGRRLNFQIPNQSPSKPLVSIVTVVFNNAKTLQRCIDSVRNQTYDNIEHIIIDGGSTDGTLSIILNNAEAIDYFISEPDWGIYSAMNKGIQLAQGEYICLLNSDDYYEQDFVEKCLQAAAISGADIVYTDLRHGETILHAQSINEGVLFGHLNICHNTFLARSSCYDEIGFFEEGYKIVSDAVWVRAAYRQGLRFHHVKEPLFTLSPGGLSSANTDEQRRFHISEVVSCYLGEFSFLSPEEAEEIYLLRFNKQRVHRVLNIARRHCSNNLFKRALARYLEYCFARRENFVVNQNEPIELFKAMIELADVTGADRRCLRVKTKNGFFGDLLAQIDTLVAKRKPSAKKTILHFVTVFSSPSETFIYDLIKSLEADEQYDNFVLFEHRELSQERPYEKGIQVFVNDYSPEVVQQLYRHILETLRPDLIVAHFAINAHRFCLRTMPLGIRVPMIVMTHGIDVFLLQRPGDYRDFVVNDLAKRSEVIFTAVSKYLQKHLIESGIHESKVALVPNAIDSRFFEHRKTKNFFDGSRKLRILSVGRLIYLKGHHILLDALSLFRNQCTTNFDLTLVYGRGDERLKDLKDQCNRLGLDKHVIFVPFIDFIKQPDFFFQFDVFVHPSTYSNDDLRRSETFGMTVLEAISAGLPVIVSDAGGIPEVVGTPNPFARIVPHGNALALFEALRELYITRSGFSDNQSYALERLNIFSRRAQLNTLVKLIDRVALPPIKVALFSKSTIQGAGYAAYRVAKGLQSTSLHARLFTTVRNHEKDDFVTVLRHPSGDGKKWNEGQEPPLPGYTIFTRDVNHISNQDLLRLVEPYDVINLHWYARFLSVDNIAALTHSGKPVVITVRDMMPITGGCHFFHGCERWKSDCRPCPQLPESVSHVAAKVLSAKRQKYNFSNLTLVAISNHTRRILEQAPYFQNCRIEVIHNSIELDVFRPYEKLEQRKAFGLPIDRKIIAYAPSYSSEVKGYREIYAALELLFMKQPQINPFVMIIGNDTPITRKIRQDKKVLGYINDNNMLARAYSAADVVVVPSLEETFSNTAAEAIACGVPVVGFKTGAIPELVIDGITGYTYHIGDYFGLVDGIIKVLTGPDMTNACRSHAEMIVPFMTQARKYEQLFYEIRNRIIRFMR